MQSAECPQCGKEVSVGSNPVIGKVLVCPHCKTDLEVVWLDPVELDFPYTEDEDFDEFEDDFEETYED